MHNGFDAYFALLTQKRDRHRWSVRFDDFGVSDIDSTPMDSNSESGQAVTLAWRYEPKTNWSVGLEWLAVDVDRMAFGYFGLPATMRENLTRFEVRYRLQSRPR